MGTVYFYITFVFRVLLACYGRTTTISLCVCLFYQYYHYICIDLSGLYVWKSIMSMSTSVCLP